MNLLNKLILAYFVNILFLGCISSKENLTLKISSVFIEDTVRYQTLSYKLKIENDGIKARTLSFKKKSGLDVFSSGGSSTSGAIFLLDSLMQKKCELLLFPTYPDEIIIKGHGKVNLTFVDSCFNFFTRGVALFNKSEIDTKITNELKKSHFFYYIYRNDKYKLDSIAIEIDKNIQVNKRPVFLEDVK